MSKLKRMLSLIMAIFMMLALFAGCGGGGGDADTPPAGTDTPPAGGTDQPAGDTPAVEFTGEIQIGVLNGMMTSQFGQMMQHGVQLAVDETNAAGGINGLEIIPVFEDTQNDPDIALNAAQKLLSANEISGVVGPHHSSNVFAIDGVVRASDIPFIIGGTNPGIPALDNDNFYGCRTNDSICARAAAAFVAEQEGVTKVAVLTLSDDFGAGGKEVATAYFDEIGMEYVAESFNLGDTDMSATIMKVMNEGCNGIFLWTLSDEFVIMMRQLYELEFDVPTVTNPGLSDATVSSMCDPAWLVGKYCTADFVVNSTDPLIVDFVSRFESLYGAQPDLAAACYYSGALILFEAMKRCEDPTDRAALREELLKTADFTTPVGTFTARPDENQQLIWGINIIQKNEDGSFTFIDYVQS